MASKNLAKGLKRSALTVALGLCFVGGVQAQSNSAGAITGSANPGDTITLTNPNTGFNRSITAGADGMLYVSNFGYGSSPGAGQVVKIDPHMARPMGTPIS